MRWDIAYLLAYFAGHHVIVVDAIIAKSYTGWDW